MSFRSVLVVVLSFLAACASDPFDRSPDVVMPRDGAVTYRQELASHVGRVDVRVRVDVRPLKELGAAFPEDEVELGGSGSGVVVAERGKWSLVLTAGHVCRVPPYIQFFHLRLPVNGHSLSVLTLAGKSLEARVLRMDTERDTCSLAVYGDVGKPAGIARSMPPWQAKVHFAGAPAVVFGRGLVIVAEAIYSGPEIIENQRYMTLVSVLGPGASGGPVFYDGLVVGLVVMGDPDYGHVCWAVDLENVRIAAFAGLYELDLLIERGS